MIKSNGYTTLITTLVVSAVIIGTAVFLLQNNVSLSGITTETYSYYSSKTIADACAERALMEIRNSTNYTGSDTLTVGNGECSYTVTNTGGQNRNIETEGTDNNSYTRIIIEIDAINPNINITRWEYVE